MRQWLTLAMFSTECRQLVGHGLATFVYEHALTLVIDFERCTTPAVKDGIATELLDYMEMSKARDFTQCMSLFGVAWHGTRDEQAVRVALINGEGDTIIEAMTLLLTHGTHTLSLRMSQQKRRSTPAQRE